jgi:hypothetical protein
VTPARKAIAKRIIKLAAAAVLLAALYRAADWRAVGRVLASLDGGYLLAGLMLFVPQTLVSAARWKRLVAPLAAISLGDAMRQTLAASALNLVMPSKLGDLSKAAMLPAERTRAGGLAVLEKVADVVALALVWAAGAWGVDGRWLSGLLLALAASGIWRRWRESAGYSLASYSLVLWTLHLLQIDCFLKAAGVFVPWTVASARIPAAIFAGLLPISFCGIGTRDSALVWLFSDLASTPAMAAVGALTALRYLVPGAAGIPFVSGLLSRRRSAEQRLETDLRPGFEARKIGQQLFDRPEAAVDQFALAGTHVGRLDVEQMHDAQVDLADLGQVVVQ